MSAFATVNDDCQTVASDLLGPLTVPRAELVRFPGGLYGFPECRTFVLAPAARDGLFWLQSAEYSALSFLLVDPFAQFPAYHIDLDDVDITRLGTNDPQHLLVLAIVTMPARADEPCTANLHAPILFNMRDRHAHQSIRGDEGHGIREPFWLDHASAPASASAER